MGQVIHLRSRYSRHTAEAQARRERLGKMIRAARGDLTQMELASRLGVGQPAVSGWEAGKVDLTAEMLWSLESSLDRPHGWFSVAGGFTDPTLEPFLALLEASTAAVRFLSQGEVEAIRATCTNSVDDAS